jgi:hypothetical protein
MLLPQGIKTLCKQAFHPDTATDAAREALSCVANTMLLKAEMRTTFAALGLWAPAIERLKVGCHAPQKIRLSLTYVYSGQRAAKNF